MSVSSRVESNPLLAALKQEVLTLVWEAFDDCKDQSISLRLQVPILRIPVNVSIKVERLRPAVELITGTTEEQVISRL